jgi:hypothetical protein
MSHQPSSSSAAPPSITIDQLFGLARGEDRVAFRDALLLAKEQDLDVNQRDGPLQVTLFHEAAQWGCRENVRELLTAAGKAAGFHEVNAVDKEGRTALHYACMNGHTGVVEEIVEGAGREADFKAFAVQIADGNWWSGYTALHLATHEEMVGLLLGGASRVGEEERHALIHATDFKGRTAMHFHGPQRGLLKLCRDDELDVLLVTEDSDCHNPLHFAACYSDAEGLRALLRGVRERGWRRGQEQEEWRNSLNGNGLTALHLAIISSKSSRDAVRAARVRALLALDAEESEIGEGKKRKEEEEEKKERMEEYEGGVDPNKGCKGRTGEFWPVAAKDDDDDEEDDDY